MAKRVRPASHYQRPDAPIRLIAKAHKPAIRRAMKQSLAHLSEIFDKAKALHVMKAGRPDLIKDAIDLGHFGEVLKGVFDKIADARFAGAELGKRKINGGFAQRRRAVRFRKFDIKDWMQGVDPIDKAIGDRFNFDRFDDRTQARIREAQDALIKDISDGARDSIDGIVIAGVQAGLSPEDIVGDVRELIGLTENQATAVLNYRDMLESGDRDALIRRLRNHELDDTIRQAINDGQPLDEALLDQAVNDYRDNFLDYRASTIAQTESVRASNAGLRDAYRQAIDRGALPDEAVTRHWQIALDEKTCPICLSIPDLNPDGVGVDEVFESEDGPQDDPPIHTNCRCSVEYVTDLDKVPDDEEAA